MRTPSLARKPLRAIGGGTDPACGKVEPRAASPLVAIRRGAGVVFSEEPVRCGPEGGETVYPPRFDYLAPTTIEEVVESLGERAGDAKVMAGGQSLIPVLKLRIASVGTIVDLNRVAGLDAIDDANGELRIGALVRHVQAERSPILTKRYGLLGETARLVADPLVRNRGTVCGSLAHADPQGDWGSALLAARASVVVRGAGGERMIPVEDLAFGPFMTTLAPDEVITEVRVPDPGPRTGGAYLKLERKVGDFATAAVGVQVTLENGHVGQVGIGLTGVGATNLRATAAEDALRGGALDAAAIAAAAEQAAEGTSPPSDLNASADYKRHLARVLCRRALEEAAA
jgi:carbon-monoxide dehydrogenase medium subunit